MLSSSLVSAGVDVALAGAAAGGAAAGAGVGAGAGSVGVAGAGAALGFATITTMNFFSSILYLEIGSSSAKTEYSSRLQINKGCQGILKSTHLKSFQHKSISG